MMDAVETLRMAERMARSGAEHATAGPWKAAFGNVFGEVLPDPTGWSGTTIAQPGKRSDADHMGAWHPKVALAVAMIWHEVAYQIAENDLPESDPIAAEAISAARAYLGEVA